MEENKENEEEENVEIILSVCNDNGKTAAVAYNLMSLELFVYKQKSCFNFIINLISISRFTMKFSI